MSTIPYLLVILTLWFELIYCEPSVHILAENLDQTVTSTTLQWIPTDGNDPKLLQNAVVAAYQTVERKQNNLLSI